MITPLDNLVIPCRLCRPAIMGDLGRRGGQRSMDWSSAVVVQLRPFVQDSEGLEWCNRETAFLSSLSLV